MPPGRPPRRRKAPDLTGRSGRQAKKESVRAAREAQSTVKSTSGPSQSVNDVHLLSIGKMDVICGFCHAMMFKGELVGDHFSLCCGNGAVALQDQQELRDVPQDLQNLFTSPGKEGKNFREEIRKYNAALAFASITCNVDNTLSNRGKYAFRIHGEAYVNVGDLKCDGKSYNQLFVIDSSSAVSERMGRKENAACTKETMEKLTQIIEDVNPYSKVYKSFAQIENQEGGFEDLRLIFAKDPTKDPRRFNEPRGDEVAVVFSGEDGEPPDNIDFAVERHGCKMHRLHHTSAHCDPMAYPLLFPNGEQGWHPFINRIGEKKTETSRTRVTMKDFYKHRFMVREPFSALHNAGKLFQQYVALSYVKHEANRLFWIRQNQSTLRVEQYKGLMDFVVGEKQDASSCGRRYILPSSFAGSPRNMQQNFQDAMAIVNRFGKPDLFITFTCNPQWLEIQENLVFEQKAEFRPDLCVRVFHLKLKELLRDLKDKSIFGDVAAILHVVEFQKRGLPHAHILVILQGASKIRGREMIDRIVSAETPDPESDPLLFEQVTKHMVHGPCGGLNPKSCCMENNVCTKDFPIDFADETLENVDGYPQYRRRRGTTFTKNGKILDNRWIVPYNVQLIKKFDAHINVEICSTIKSVKYLYKYVYKGHDCAKLELQQDQGAGAADQAQDEVKMFVDGRYVTSPEGAWRIFGFPMHTQSHAIIRLAVHLPQHQIVIFKEGEEGNALKAAADRQTTLTAFFKLCESDPDAGSRLYTELSESYVFRGGKWCKRKQGGDKVIARMYAVSPADQERYFLRLLLLNVRGPTSFDDLKRCGDQAFSTFYESAKAHGLLEDDREWDRCLGEASTYAMPNVLRQLFVTICLFCSPSNPSASELFNNHKESLCEDYLQNFPADVATSYALLDIQHLLILHRKDLGDFNLPLPKHARVQEKKSNQFDAAMEAEKGQENYTLLNADQKQVVDTIINACNSGKQKLFCLDGPGGTGKTFVYNTIMHLLRGDHKEVIPVALTGIAATLLQGGQTAHSAFKIPVPLNESSTSSIKPGDGHAMRLLNCDLILWDEVSMVPGLALTLVDRLMRDITRSSEPFGGKVILLGGDFRQCLPIVPRGGEVAIVSTTIKRTALWIKFASLKLTRNMRADPSETTFASWLLDLGNGSLPSSQKYGDSSFEAINSTCGPDSDLVDKIFGDINSDTFQGIAASRAILTPCNAACLELNDQVVDMMGGSHRVYKSVDQVDCDDPREAMNYPMEFINSQLPSGLPPHLLKLKIGAIVMLLKNLDAANGLCNGTRLIVKQMHDHLIEVAFLNGSREGEIVFIPRIRCTSTRGDVSMPFSITRLQFPVRVAFAMTINKSQGQTFDKVGLYLPEPVFAHGQIYVAYSRVRRSEDIVVHIKPQPMQGLDDDKCFTQNVVYRGVL